MSRSQINKIERIAILSNLLPILLMGLAGLFFGIVGESSAVVLDGMFSSVLFVTVLLATFVGIVANKPRDNVYPQGHWLLENLYVLFKIVILLAIVSYSFIEGVSGLFHYFNGTLETANVNTALINYYYYIKTALVIISFCIYTYFLKKIKYQSDILKLERKSVLIDGGITISIALGFVILSQFESTREISDQIILTLLSAFLFYEVFKDFRSELNKTLGKRTLQDRELYYKHYFNLYFTNMTITDVYIHFAGKVAIVSVTASFDGRRSLNEITKMEHQIKEIMFDEYDKVFLYTYWEKKHNIM